MRSNYDRQQVNVNRLTPQQRIGNDIRLAKAIYEKMNNVDADIEPVDVNKWLREAKAVQKFIKANTLQQVLEELFEIPFSIEI